MASDAFAALARQNAADLAFGDARVAVVAHPIGGSTEASLRARGDAALDDVLALLE